MNYDGSFNIKYNAANRDRHYSYNQGTPLRYRNNTTNSQLGSRTNSRSSLRNNDISLNTSNKNINRSNIRSGIRTPIKYSSSTNRNPINTNSGRNITKIQPRYGIIKTNIASLNYGR